MLFEIMKTLEEVIKQRSFKTENEKVIVNIDYTAYWLNDINNKIVNEYDISTQQYNILRILRGQHPNCVTVNLIRERMLDKNSGVSRMVEKLRKKGMLERHLNESDRRQVDVKITEQGLAVLNELDEKITELHSLVNSLNEDEKKQLNYLLDKLRG